MFRSNGIYNNDDSVQWGDAGPWGPAVQLDTLYLSCSLDTLF